MKRVLLTVMFVLSLFIMCGGCEEENHRRDRHSDRWEQDRHSERWEREGDRGRDHDSDRHEEHHVEVEVR
jgi:hypothetical protein